MMFLDDQNREEVREIMEKNEDIKEAVVKVHEMSEDEKIRRLADLREKAIMDEKAIRKAGYRRGMEKGLEDGKKIGIEQGIKQGKNEGKIEEKLEIAKKMKEKGLGIEQIKEITGLNQEEINKL